MKVFSLAVAMFLLGTGPVEAGVFEKLKALEGRWLADTGDEETEVRYEVHSDGSAIVEHLWGMVTVYHKDGENLIATHYCSMGNQPRLVARPADITSSAATFRFLDITNDTGAGHISGVAFRFTNDSEFVQTWTYRKASGEESSFDATLRRLPEAGSLGVVLTKRQNIVVETMHVTDLDEVEPILAVGLPRVAAYISERGGTITGPAILRAIKFEDDEKIFEYGFPVAAPVPSTTSVANHIIPAGLAARAEHYGPLDTLPLTHGRLDQFVNDNGLRVIGPVWEVYVSDPATVPAHKLLTEVFYPVAFSTEGESK